MIESSFSNDTSPPDRSRLNAALEAILSQSIEAGVPGTSAQISSSLGTLWRSTAGIVDDKTQDPVTENHLFGIGSITKVFVAVVILQLIDETRLRLDDTIECFLDSKVYHQIENAAESTIGGLLSHTAGVDSWEDDPVWIVHGRGRELDPGKKWKKTEPLDYVRRKNSDGPEIGKYSYSNTNYTLLGLVIEEITQSTAESEIRKRILEPLKMDCTFLEGFEEPRPHISSRRYHWNTAQFRDVAGICPEFTQPRENLIDATGSNLSVEWTAGGMVTSPSDLTTFALALRDGNLLSPSSLEIMKDWRLATGSAEIGHGLFRYQDRHGAGAWLGHLGSVLGFTGALLWKEEGDCVVCIVANVGTVHTGSVPSSAAHIVMESTFLKLASDLTAYEK